MSGGGGGGGGGLLNNPLELALVAGTAIAAPYAAPALLGGEGAVLGSTMLGSGLVGAGMGGLGGALLGYNPLQTGLLGGLGGAAAAGLGVGAGAGAGAGAGVGTTAGAGGGFGLTGAGTTGAGSGLTAAGAPGITAGGSGIGFNAGAAGATGLSAGAGATGSGVLTPAASSVLAGMGGGTSLISGIPNAALYGAGGLGLMALLKNDAQHYGVPTSASQPYTGGNLAKFKYDPNQYTPAVAVPPTPPYQADYSGYARPPGYAGGGLMDPNSEPVDFMGGGMYPQSQQHTSAYATPTQMPTSAQTVASLYEPKTNPLTGDEMANMAAGGYGKDALADLMGARDAIQKYKSQYSQSPSAVTSAAKGGDYNAMLAMNQLRGTPNANYAGGGVVAFDNGGQAQLTPDQMAQMQAQATQQQAPQYDPYSELQQQAMYARMAGLPQITPTSSAQGGLLSSYAGGGGISSLGGYSDGGRMLKGPGDGMSDSIPATIANKRPARLADNEFVVPADVVSHLGNGSSDAGAKKLYAMMDKVRKARTGKAKQAPAIKADKYMPA